MITLNQTQADSIGYYNVTDWYAVQPIEQSEGVYTLPDVISSDLVDMVGKSENVELLRVILSEIMWATMQGDVVFPPSLYPTYNSSILDSREPTNAELDALDLSMSDIITELSYLGAGRCFFIQTDHVEGKYFLYYASDATTINILTSNDALTWSAYSENPAFILDKEIAILKLDSTYHCYYGKDNIYHTSSDNPLSFSSTDHLLISNSESGWDTYLRYPSVVLKDGIFYLYYMGSEDNHLWKIGVATANHPQGPFTKYKNNPVIDLGEEGEFDDTDVFDPHAVIFGDTLYLAYTGGNPKENLGVAKSTDMFTFSKYINNPIIAENAGGQNETINFNLNIAEGKLLCHCSSRVLVNNDLKLIQSSVVMN